MSCALITSLPKVLVLASAARESLICPAKKIVFWTGFREVRLTFPPTGAGVNLGGWLVLEDWFFSGSSGSYLPDFIAGKFDQTRARLVQSILMQFRDIAVGKTFPRKGRGTHSESLSCSSATQ